MTERFIEEKECFFIMKCRFCGKRIKKDSNICSKCGKEVTEGLGTDELIDALPELHDELDNISKLRAKEKRKEEKKEKRAEHKAKRIVVAIIVVVAILGGICGGMLYLKHEEQRQKEEEAQIITTSAVDSLVERTFITSGFGDLSVTDSTSAKAVIAGQKGTFSFVNVDTEFELSKELKIGSTTIYRFSQKYNDIPVYGGEMVLMVDKYGKVIGLNGVYVPTNGLLTTYSVDKGRASTAITEYVNSLDDFAVVEGINITDVKKSVLNTDSKAYLAYTANVSGYNASSEYVAYDVFIDGISGNGICVSVTSSFENESTITENDIEDSYIFKMATASDKFNWNDDTMDMAREPIAISDVESGNASAFISGVKNAVDSAYNYFNNAFDYRGLSGDGDDFLVYINSNEYVEEDLPTEKAMYTNGKLMFFREDLTQGDINYNTVMHEYAHGVMHNIAGFSGTMDFSENSAIAEGLADVFAELAEATVSGTADWLHGERNLYEPSLGYHSTIPAEISIKSVEDCYYYSTIVSHLASQISQSIPNVSAQNELWFKTMCFMTRNSDFSELSSILNVVVSDMYKEYKLTDVQYSQITEIIKSLDVSVHTEIVE